MTMVMWLLDNGTDTEKEPTHPPGFRKEYRYEKKMEWPHNMRMCSKRTKFESKLSHKQEKLNSLSRC